MVVAVDFRASCHEPGSVGEVMKELSFTVFHTTSWVPLSSLYIKSRLGPLDVLVTPRY